MKANIKLSLPYQVSQETLSLITNSEHGDAAISAIKQAFNEALELAARECEKNENMRIATHPARLEADPDSVLARKCAAAIRKLKVE